MNGPPSRRSTSHVRDRTGERHGRLTVIRRVTSAPGIVWLCRCDCGRWPEVTSDSLYRRRSCGCLKVEVAKQREAILATTRRPRYYPLDPRAMAETCRKLARDLRNEHAMGWGMVSLGRDEGNILVGITRAEAADSLDEQAERWEAECRTGEPNRLDRARIGL